MRLNKIRHFLILKFMELSRISLYTSRACWTALKTLSCPKILKKVSLHICTEISAFLGHPYDFVDAGNILTIRSKDKTKIKQKTLFETISKLI